MRRTWKRKKANLCNDRIEPKILVRLTKPGVKAIEYPDSVDLHQDLHLRDEPLDLKAEQDRDADIETLKKWMQVGEIPDLTYANSCLKKYAKQFNRLIPKLLRRHRQS